LKPRRILGYIFIVFAIILTITILGQIPELIRTIIGVSEVFTGTQDSYQIGKVIGSTLYWIIHIALTIALWMYGKRWIKLK
jgi:hypothetical protein